MSYLDPTMKFVSPENLKIGFLHQQDDDITGFAERELSGKESIVQEIKIPGGAFKELPLCKGPNNKHWVLKANGGIILKYIND
tara:strand:+ start:689 stop:937 length:249 start_codon:yes stop_codon:yes gene_type:complete